MKTSRKLWAVQSPSGKILRDTVTNGQGHCWTCMHCGLKWPVPEFRGWVKQKKARGFKVVPVIWKQGSAGNFAIVNPQGVIQWQSVKPTLKRTWRSFLISRQCSGQVQLEFCGTWDDAKKHSEWINLMKSKGYEVVRAELKRR